MLLDSSQFRLPDAFDGRVRLFPLPNLVLFPGVLQPLHVFEPRYRQLVADAQRSDELVALALLQPDWERQYHGAPPVHSGVCIGRILTSTQLPDGRYNILVGGLQRARIVRECTVPRLYRVAEVQLIETRALDGDEDGGELERRIRAYFARLAGRDCGLDLQSIACQLKRPLTLESLVDLVAFCLDAPLSWKQQILEAESLRRRIELASDYLEQEGKGIACGGGHFDGYPPEFSRN